MQSQGRECEWIFAHPEGQWAVARDCLSRRVILVVLNRGHSFTASNSVQAELSPLVCLLLSLSCQQQQQQVC